MGLRFTRHFSLWQVHIWICRLWGFITAIGLWGIGIETAYRGHVLGAYIIVSAFVMTFFETVFIVIFWIELCLRDESHVCTVFWRRLGWVDCWKKGVLYMLMSIGCFIKPQVWLAIISGVMVVISSTLYFLKTIKWQQEQREEELRAKNKTYDRFDEVQDDLDDNVLRSVTDQPIYSPESLAEQDEILDV